GGGRPPCEGLVPRAARPRVGPPRASAGPPAPSCAAHLFVAQDPEPDLDLDLELAHLSVRDEPAHLGDLEPVDALEALGGARDGVPDGLLNRLVRHADQLDELVRLVRHGTAPSAA